MRRKKSAQARSSCICIYLANMIEMPGILFLGTSLEGGGI